MELRNTEKTVEDLIVKYKYLSSCKNIMLKDLNSIEKDMNLSSDDPPLNKEEKEETKDLESITLTESEFIDSLSSAEQVLSLLQSMQHQIVNLSSVMDKFRQRRHMKDPVTLAPRYGQQTLRRVSNLLIKYDAIQKGLEVAFYGDDFQNTNTSIENNTNESLVQQLQREIQSQQKQKEEMERKKQAEIQAALLTQQQAQQEEELQRQKEQMEETARIQQEREDLARRAEQVRRERLEHERNAIEMEARQLQMEREADAMFIASVPKGLDGVKEQLSVLRQNCDKAELDTALGALYTLFSQIHSKPEETKFRRIRRDHPDFVNDIGRHLGGKEVLIAAGFTFTEIDGVKCFFSKEPDLESDMDGWSEWFNLVKNTMNAIEEEMMK